MCVQSDFKFFGPGLSIAQPGNLTRWKRFGARQTTWPRGTVLTRAQLEAARDGRPHAEEESSQQGQALVKMS